MHAKILKGTHTNSFIQSLVRSLRRFHLMYSNLHTPNSNAQHGTSNRIPVDDDDTNDEKKHILQTPVYWKHPKCSYRLSQHVVRALPFQKCTVNLIIQIENNWINQPRKPFIVKYCWWWLVGGGASTSDRFHGKVMNLISVSLSLPPSVCVFHLLARLLDYFHQFDRGAYATQYEYEKQIVIEWWEKTASKNITSCFVRVAYGISIKCWLRFESHLRRVRKRMAEQ